MQHTSEYQGMVRVEERVVLADTLVVVVVVVYEMEEGKYGKSD